MIALLLAGLWLQQPLLALALPVGYGSVLALTWLTLIPRLGIPVAARVPLAMATMHAGYALGWVYGACAMLLRSDAWDRDGSMATLSR
jgi:hypothetical protein